MGSFELMKLCNGETDSLEHALVFYVNGKKIVEVNPDPERTLLAYLREELKLCGTKLGCGEGGCGACTVMISKMDRKTREIKHSAINACLYPICALHGTAVTTVEGIGSTSTRLHPIQERIAKSHGSQCGFCTPGIVMSMYALLRSKNKPSMEDLEVAFQGNLCRCTGYRPIIEGYRAFTQDYACSLGENCCKVNGSLQCDVDKNHFDTSNFTPFDPSQEPIFPPELQLEDHFHNCSLVFHGPRVTWYRPVSLKELLSLKAAHPNAKIVAGNTEIGVEVKFKNCFYPIIIHVSHVDELTDLSVLVDGLRIGSCAPISNVEEFLEAQIMLQSKVETCIYRSVLKMISYFAGKQIRNVATFGGNIMTGSPISDMNPILMAAGVNLKVMSLKRGIRTIRMDNMFFTGYRTNVIQPDEVIVSFVLPKTTHNQYFVAYKQSKRRDDDIAIVNIAVNVEFENKTDIIRDIRIAYGGIAPVTVVPTKTCGKLKGFPWNEDMFHTFEDSLFEEITLNTDAPGGVVTYRKCLSLSLFFKVYLDISQELDRVIENRIKTSTFDASGSTQFSFTASKSSQMFENPLNSQTNVEAVGRPLVHVSAYKQATGEAVYCDDIPVYNNELHLAFVLSTKSHARIISIDATQALSLEGVHKFFTSKDLTKLQNQYGPIVNDEEVFVSSIVFAQGQIIGAIVAESKQLSARAAKLVNVEYEDILPVIITLEDAIKCNSYFSEGSRTLVNGNLEEGFASADFIVEGSCRMGGQEHFYMETQAALAAPQDLDELMIVCNTQYPFEIQKQVSDMLSIPLAKITTRVKRIGGGFGGKESKTSLVALPVALAAYKLKRPVRCMLERHEDMLMTGGRHPFLFKYKVGCRKNGLLTALDIECYSNSGCTLDHSSLVMSRALLHIDNCYRIPNIRVSGKCCKTNLPSNTAFRGFGAPQAMFLTEHIIRHVAHTVGIDAVEVARSNLYVSGDKTHFNQEMENCTIRRCWDECILQSNFHNQRKQVKAFNKANRWRKRGISIVPTKYGIGFTALHLNKGTALVHVYVDGSVLISHGGTEMGQGLHTKMIQVAAHTLKICPDKIHILETSTTSVSNASPTVASSGSDVNGMAVLNACQKLNDRLMDIKTKYPQGDWDVWIEKAYNERMCLSAIGHYIIPDIGYSFETNSGHPYVYFTMGVGCSVVEIDCLTGDHKVLKTDIVMDLGSSLNPAIDIGQIEGAFMQGYGLFTMEELIYSPDGSLYSRGPGMYKIPSFSDIPTDFNISLLTGAPNPRAVYSSKAVGEPPLFLASSVFFAIKEAIASARLERNLTEHFEMKSPATSARIRMACEDEFTNKAQEQNKLHDSCVPWNVMP